MAEHGYARDYDEPIDRGEEAEQSWPDNGRGPIQRGSAGHRSQQNRKWGSESRDPRQRDVDFMLLDRDRNWEEGQNPYSYHQDWDRGSRGFEHYGQMPDNGGRRADWDRSPPNYRSHQDDHYRSWRDRQMAALDRDYADYCRERERKFHSDFDDWRRNRERSSDKNEASQLETEESMELTRPVDLAPNPTAEATLGTNTPENSGVGRS